MSESILREVTVDDTVVQDTIREKLIKRRILALRKHQIDYNLLRESMHREIFALKDKYSVLKEPIYEKRKLIITSGRNIDAEVQVPSNQKNRSGIPDFWLKVLQNTEGIDDLIQDHDIPILKCLLDITSKNNENLPGFTLEFHFGENDYFSNSVLSKEYIKSDFERKSFSIVMPHIIRSKGCVIDWKDIKFPTIKPLKSFFDFFNPSNSNVDIKDFELGNLINEHVIPWAVNYFTGEVTNYFYSSDEDDADEDDDSEFDDDSDYEDDDHSEES